MSVDWGYYDKFDSVLEKYLPAMGEGETMATQIVTAVCKLVYKWYNDGDVFDNTSWLDGWCNDLSNYANWIDFYTEAGDILKKVYDCYSDGEYEDLLKELTDMLFDEEYLEAQNQMPKQGSIYKASGRFKFVDPDDYND